MINEMKDSNCEWTCENGYDCRSCGRSPKLRILNIKAYKIKDRDLNRLSTTITHCSVMPQSLNPIY